MSATQNRDYRLQTCILGSVLIDPHGEGVSPTLSPDPIGEVFQGSETDVYSRMSNVGGTLVFACRHEESAYTQLLNLVKAQQQTIPTPALPGSIYNQSTGKRAVWKNAYFTEIPAMEMGTQSNIVNFTLRVSGLQYL